MSERRMPKLHFWTTVGVLTMILFAVVVFRRFTGGLGAVSNLHDGMPWGLWIGFDLLCGVALAAGGFTVTAVVYIFHLEKYKPIVRPSILTGFLGYLMVIVALIIDVGRPWFMWHSIVYWNHHSVMFEVSWCVMLYTTVLFLEFVPLVLERFGKKRQVHFMHKWVTPVLVILGVLLSTMHQSSLGTVYMIVPQKLHPLWYSPVMPIHFFVTAVVLGLAMTNVESFLSLRAFGKRLEPELLRGIGRGTAVMLLFALTLRVEDLIVNQKVGLAFALDKASWYYLAETVLGMLVPMILLFNKGIRRRPLALVGTQFLVVLGIMFNRMNTAVTAFQLGTGVDYTPHWGEVVISLGVVVIGFWAFSLAVRFLPVFEEGPMPDARPVDPFLDPSVRPRA